MAASGKAQALKDAYIEGIAREAGEEVMAEAGAANLADLAGKLGMEQGQQASELFDLDSQIVTRSNDGDPHVYIKQGREMGRIRDQGAANPAYGGYGAVDSTRMSPKAVWREQQQLNRMLGGN
jgi:hypothetical protein